MKFTNALRPRRSAFALALGTAAGLLACDSAATLYPTSAKFHQAQIISAYPAKRDTNGTWTRACNPGDQIDGLITNVIYESTGQGSEERDFSIRPNDVIDSHRVQGSRPNDINITSPQNVSLQLDCVKSVDAPAGAGCSDGASISSSLHRIEYVANTPNRSVGHNILLLMDQSGSMGGFVDKDSLKESANPSFAQDFGNYASDSTGHRASAARTFFNSGVSSKDRFALLTFNETDYLKVPCSEGQTGDFSDTLTTCFPATNKDIWTNGFNEIQRTTNGRSNLWRAVEESYNFLKNNPNEEGRSNHIVVVTDGPDTCDNEGLPSCERPCSTTDYTQLIAQIERDQQDPNVPPIQVHFVQFEAPGYRGRDARQVELSCVTGGHYQFINSESMSKGASSPLYDALNRALSNVRFALMGHWEFASESASFRNNDVPVGDLYGVSGSLTIKRSSNLVKNDRIFAFGYGQGEGAGNATSTWDRALTFRRSCTSDADCGATADAGECQVICSPETHTCVNGAEAINLPDGLPCGNGGSCCAGECQANGSCADCETN